MFGSSISPLLSMHLVRALGPLKSARGYEMHRPYLLVLVAALACSSAHSDRLQPASLLTVVRVPRQWEDTTATSTLKIVVRDVNRPIEPIPGTTISLTGVKEAQLVTDARGYAAQAFLPAGEYGVVVRRLGYLPLRTRITLVKGCPAWAEIYLTFDACDIGACPPVVPPRVTLSTCAPAS